MTAAEATQKTMWNNIPYDIRRGIERSIENGRHYYIGVPKKEMETYYGRYTLEYILEKLGYSLEICGPDSDQYYEIRWD